MKHVISLVFLSSVFASAQPISAPQFSSAPTLPTGQPPSSSFGEIKPNLTAAATQSESLFAAGDVSGARDALSAYLQGNADVYWLNLRYAYLSYLLKDYDSAKSYYQKAAKLAPDEQAPLEGLFYTAWQAQDKLWPDQAKALLKVDPNHREANLRLGYDAFSHHLYQEAASSYSSVLTHTPDDADALLGLAWSEFYLGDAKARNHFSRVLALYPDNASAKQGLSLLPKELYVGAGYSYAGLRYQNISFKTGGYSVAIPVSLSYSNLWSMTVSYIHTVIDFASPTANVDQKEFNFSGSYFVSRTLSLTGAYDHVSLNDPATDNGKIYTAGFNYSDSLGKDGLFPYYSAGGYYSYSKYPAFRAAQVSPHVGVGCGPVYMDFSWMQVNNNARSERLDSYWNSLSLGPFSHVTVTVKGYTGQKRTPVEEWGTLISNNQDLYLGGWRTIVSWSDKGLSLFGIYGKDNVRTNLTSVSTLDYTSTTLVGGLSYRFGL